MGESSNQSNELDDLLDNALQDFNVPSKTQKTKKVEDAPSKSANTKKLQDFDSMFNEILSNNVENDNEAIIGAVKKLSESTKDIDENLTDILKDLNFDDNEASFYPFMEGALQTFLCKDLLYPAMSEINGKYPGWLEENRTKLSESDLKRFTKQSELIQEICTEFEKESDTDTEDIKKNRFKLLLNVMQKMNECGEPPKDIIGESGFENGIPKFPSSNSDDPQCPVS